MLCDIETRLKTKNAYYNRTNIETDKQHSSFPDYHAKRTTDRHFRPINIRRDLAPLDQWETKCVIVCSCRYAHKQGAESRERAQKDRAALWRPWAYWQTGGEWGDVAPGSLYARWSVATGPVFCEYILGEKKILRKSRMFGRKGIFYIWNGRIVDFNF